MLERRREPRLSWNCTAPPSGLAGSQPVRVAGSRPQGPVGQVSRGPGAFSPQKPPKLKLRFFRKPLVGSLAKAWVSAETAASEVGTWRERSRDTPPTPPPTPPSAFWGCKGERKRVFTLSAFGNHPTRPPRSADVENVGMLRKS